MVNLMFDFVKYILNPEYRPLSMRRKAASGAVPIVATPRTHHLCRPVGAALGSAAFCGHLSEIKTQRVIWR
jgi:hypothetical protein